LLDLLAVYLGCLSNATTQAAAEVRSEHAARLSELSSQLAKLCNPPAMQFVIPLALPACCLCQCITCTTAQAAAEVRSEHAARLSELSSQLAASNAQLAKLRASCAGLQKKVAGLQEKIDNAGGEPLRKQKEQVAKLQVWCMGSLYSARVLMCGSCIGAVSWTSKGARAQLPAPGRRLDASTMQGEGCC
jgi:uncharacterized coiled-coil protein SlyX